MECGTVALMPSGALLQAKLESSSMFLMADKAVPGSSEHVLYLTAALPTFPTPTQMLLEVRP